MVTRGSFFEDLIEFEFIGFDILTVVTLKMVIFWDVTPSSPVEVYRCFGGTYCLCLQDRRISQATSEEEVASRTLRLLLVLFILEP
jgi:hypothetical protein